MKAAQGLYDPMFEHDACGVGMLAHIHGEKSHAIVDSALTILENMRHRGAEGADSKTGDGAGILLQIPHEFILLQGIPVPEKGRYGTGLFFMPKDETVYNDILEIIRHESERLCLCLLAIRDVPVCSAVLGEEAKATEPDIKQFFFTGGNSQDELELKLYLLRKHIEKQLRPLPCRRENGENAENDDGDPHIEPDEETLPRTELLLRAMIAAGNDPIAHILAMQTARQIGIVVQLSITECQMRIERRAADNADAAQHDLVYFYIFRDRLHGKRDQAHKQIHHARRDGTQEADLLYAPETPPGIIRLALPFFLR